VATGPGGAILTGTLVDLIISRSAIGDVTASVGGVQQIAFADTSNLASFTGSNILFFIDDLQFPGEASGGFVDFIQITINPGVPVPGPIVGAGLPGLILAVAFSAGGDGGGR